MDPQFDQQRAIDDELILKGRDAANVALKRRLVAAPMSQVAQRAIVPAVQVDADGSLWRQGEPVAPVLRALALFCRRRLKSADLDAARVHPLPERVARRVRTSAGATAQDDDRWEACLL